VRPSPRLLAAVFSSILCVAASAFAHENLDTERMLSDVIQQGAMEAQGEMTSSGGWGVLPQIGYSPEKGPNVGIKFTDRNATAQRMTFDLDASYALKQQRNAGLTAVAPHLFGDKLIAMVEGEYSFDPTKEFFGLGNNEVGPNPLSTHEEQLFSLLGTVAARPWPRITLALTGGFADTRIRRGELENGHPSTVEAFSDLVGIRGGRTNPLAFSVVFNSREDVTRPTRGWNIILKIQHVNHNLWNDFHFTRYILDGSYLYPLMTRRQVLGLRIGGEYIDAKTDRVPFYEL